jgi:hypothetical protein
VTARELLDQVREVGADLRLVGTTGVELLRFRRLDFRTITALRARKTELREVLEAQALAEAAIVARAAVLLREGRWDPLPAPCPFQIGKPGEKCRRCSGPWLEHYPER